MSSSKKPICPADAAHELITDLHRHPHMIPLYNNKLLRESADHLKRLYAENYAAVQSLDQSSMDLEKENITAVVFAKQAVMERIKRCCCTYIEERKNRLKQLRWKHGGVLPEDIKQNLSAEELDWFKAYNKQVCDFQQSFGEEGLNLLLHTRPPKKLFTQVRVIQDYGEYETIDGNCVMLKKDTMLHMLSVDCERLVKRGILQVVESASLSA